MPALTDDESIQRANLPAKPRRLVANILTKATEYDFFMDPVPVEGAGSGFVIDARGYILTNFHVVGRRAVHRSGAWRSIALSGKIHRRRPTQ